MCYTSWTLDNKGIVVVNIAVRIAEMKLVFKLFCDLINFSSYSKDNMVILGNFSLFYACFVCLEKKYG